MADGAVVGKAEAPCALGARPSGPCNRGRQRSTPKANGPEVDRGPNGARPAWSGRTPSERRARSAGRCRSARHSASYTERVCAKPSPTPNPMPAMSPVAGTARSRMRNPLSPDDLTSRLRNYSRNSPLRQTAQRNKPFRVSCGSTTKSVRALRGRAAHGPPHADASTGPGRRARGSHRQAGRRVPRAAGGDAVGGGHACADRNARPARCRGGRPFPGPAYSPHTGGPSPPQRNPEEAEEDAWRDPHPIASSIRSPDMPFQQEVVASLLRCSQTPFRRGESESSIRPPFHSCQHSTRGTGGNDPGRCQDRFRSLPCALRPRPFALPRLPCYDPSHTRHAPRCPGTESAVAWARRLRHASAFIVSQRSLAGVRRHEPNVLAPRRGGGCAMRRSLSPSSLRADANGANCWKARSCAGVAPTQLGTSRLQRTVAKGWDVSAERKENER
jgi:hypothetical protein